MCGTVLAIARVRCARMHGSWVVCAIARFN